MPSDRYQASGLLTVTALASVLTLVTAASVVSAPSTRIFGMEIVGRHHDPFTLIDQFRDPVRLGMYSQPATDGVGYLLARAMGPVAGYNWLVLISFPLAAATAYLLASYIGLSRGAAMVASLAYAFSPFHFAHAAYHPHVAQTQWFPLYFLALWRCLEKARPAAMGLLFAVTIGLALSNFYAALIVAVVNPIAITAFWFAGKRDGQSRRALFATISSLLCLAIGGGLYAVFFAPTVIAEPDAFAVPRGDLVRYGATWASYLLPPVQHPLWGETARRIWDQLGVQEGLLEQQLSLGYGLLALTAIAIWPSRGFLGGSSAVTPRWVVLIAPVAIVALLCSLAPERQSGAAATIAPSGFLYEVLPMFRAYARFGVIVHLMLALIAGMGVDRLLRAGSRRAQVACVALLLLTVTEYAVWPPALSRDVLPTTAHRWIVDQPMPLRVLDCVPLSSETASIPWLTDERVSVLTPPFDDCAEPNLPDKLAADGYTHLLLRHDALNGLSTMDHDQPAKLRGQISFPDAMLLAVTAPAPTVYMKQMHGLHPRERDAGWSWRWMGSSASWTIANTSDKPAIATVDVEMVAFPRSRAVDLRLDAQPAGRLIVGPNRQRYRIGPLTLTPGTHEIVFDPIDPATSADAVLRNGDPRLLSIAIGRWEWWVQSPQ